MNRRTFFGLFTLPLAVAGVPAKPVGWGAGQSPSEVNNSARVMMANSKWLKPAGCTTVTIEAIGFCGGGSGPYQGGRD